MRFRILQPYHGENQTLWYIQDTTTDEIIASINQRGEINANYPLNYKED